LPYKNLDPEHYTMAKNRWASADSWPPQHARPKTFYLHSNGHANSLYGDGSLSLERPHRRFSGHVHLRSDEPRSSSGRRIVLPRRCGVAGSYDQRGVEARADVLVYDSPRLAESLKVTGSVRATPRPKLPASRAFRSAVPR